MFDFWKEVIINDAERLSVVEGKVRVARCADYDPAYVETVYKTYPTVGACARVNLKDLISAESRVAIELGLSVGQDSEYARPWSVFKKPFVVEAKDEAGLIKALREAVPAHIGHVVVGEGTAELVINDPKVCVKSVKTATFNSDAKVNDWNALEEKEGVITPNAVPVGTSEWILENLRFPTHVNTRIAAPNADDMPNGGANYVQYAFEYAVPKRGFHGQGAVGQAITSVTHHVFYVREDLAPKADSVFAKLGGLVEINEPVVGENVAKAEAEQEYYTAAKDADYTVEGKNAGAPEAIA